MNRRAAWNAMSPEAKSFAIALRNEFGDINLVAYKEKEPASDDTGPSDLTTVLGKNYQLERVDEKHYNRTR